MDLDRLSLSLKRWRRCVLRLLYLCSCQACDLFEQTIRQPQLRGLRRLALQRAALERRARQLQQQEQLLLAAAGEQVSRPPGRRLVAEEPGEVHRPRVEHVGRSKYLTPMLEATTSCRHRNVKHGANSDWSWTKCQDCGAIEQIPKVDIGQMQQWNNVLRYQAPDYTTPMQRTAEKAEPSRGAQPMW